MKEKTKITLIIGGILLLIVGTISLSFAFLSVSKKQDLANNFTSGCLNISIENESSAITLNNTYPISDVEGLELAGYTFTIKNTCSTSTNFMINLESLNQTTNTLDTQYIKTSISSDTMDNLIQKLESNLVTKNYIEGSYIAHNIYKGTINGNSTKEFNLKLWIDYDTTKEQGANKTYTSKINVIANPDLEIEATPEIKTTLVDNILEGTITGSATTVKYCTSDTNICTPNQDTTITDNKINIEMNRVKNEIACISINNGKTTCNRVEKISAITIPDIIASFGSNLKSGTPDFTSTAEGAETEEDNGIYKTSDPMYGESTETYYWRGAATTNHVIFANKCWRIVRINGDESVRLIYNGSVESGNTCTGNGENSGSIAVTSQTYSKGGVVNRSEYVGYTYTTSKQRPEGTVEESNLKTQTETWFNNNFTEAQKAQVADGKFCNDRNIESGTWSSQPNSHMDYAGRGRVYINQTPALSCDSKDVYILKVGAITADEVAFAGGTTISGNSSYYLYNGQYYWTMTPAYWYANLSLARVFVVHDLGTLYNGEVDGYGVHVAGGVRPVINLKSNTEFATGGQGTTSKPYVVQ